MIKILVAEDEPHLRAAIAKSLSNDGYSVIECFDGKNALETFCRQHIDIIITDIMMPRMDGNQLVSEVRAMGRDIPILMLTALDSLNDKEKGFGSGVDDYLVKPIHIKELGLRVKALLRRYNINSSQRIELSHTVIDSIEQSLKISGCNIELNKKEFLLLFKLLSNPNIIFGREQLLNEIWGGDSNSSDRTVDTHISWLRDKAVSPDYEITTVWGLGYKLILK